MRCGLPSLRPSCIRAADSIDRTRRGASRALRGFEVGTCASACETAKRLRDGRSSLDVFDRFDDGRNTRTRAITPERSAENRVAHAGRERCATFEASPGTRSRTTAQPKSGSARRRRPAAACPMPGKSPSRSNASCISARMRSATSALASTARYDQIERSSIRASGEMMMRREAMGVSPA